MSARLILILLMVWLAAPAAAVQPEEQLRDPALEARARALSKDLRCVVCRNQSIDDSNASIAKDLRVLVRQRLQAGDTDAQVLDYVVARYGQYVLLDPPVERGTLALWFGPALIAGIAVLGGALYVRRRQNQPAPAVAPDLTPEEAARLRALMDTGERGS
jgi:cytochrome c-type biogenesis protein CcmH